MSLLLRLVMKHKKLHTTERYVGMMYIVNCNRWEVERSWSGLGCYFNNYLEDKKKSQKSSIKIYNFLTQEKKILSDDLKKKRMENSAVLHYIHLYM